MPKCFMHPTPSQALENTAAGIPNAILNLAKHLPAHGWEVIENPAAADLIAHHAGSGVGTADICHSHGLYPTSEPGFALENWHTLINGRVIESIRTAKAVTVPSDWVAQILRRDMHIDPHVIHWAVNAEEWRHDYQHEGYVLWNKNRIEGVCTPEWVNKLASALSNVPFLTTFGDTTLKNVVGIGILPHSKMKPVIQKAAVYLATTKETGDIGSREALASGVPVLGFRQGALPDFVEHGVNGFLAEPGDFEGLLAGLEYCLKYRDELSINALESASQWSWSQVAQQFAQLYDSVLTPHQGVKISIIVPVFNYQDYVVDCLDSIYRQQTTFSHEIIVVNDGSTDNSLEIVRNWMDDHSHLNMRVIDQSNQGVAVARNNGIEIATGELITCIDSDDQMEQGYLQVCANALDNDRGLGIAYTGLQINGNGNPHSFPPDFNWNNFKQRQNQVPSLCMFRKEAWERAGKFRQYRATGEDADLYLRIAAIGYRCKKVTDKPLFNYRMGHSSATTIVRTGQKQDPFSDPEYGYFVGGMAAGGGNYPVRNYDQPLISVIIPVGEGHEEYVKQALDSVECQTFTKWEILLINDTGATLDLSGYPYVKVISTRGRIGASASRNLGITAAQGSLITFLDADDYLHPAALEKMLRLYKQTGRYVYSDWQMLTVQGELKYHECPEFSPNLIFEIGYFHPITCLIPTKDVKRIMFDETYESWEDTHFYMRLISSGLCGVRLPEALLTYRYTTGNLREKGAQNAKQLRQRLINEFSRFIEQKDTVVCSCNNTPPPEIEPGMELLKVRLSTPEFGRKTHVGLATGTQYRRSNDEVFFARVEDIRAEPEKYMPIPDIEPEQPQTIIPAPPIANAILANI